jgi:hypothetical protein
VILIHSSHRDVAALAISAPGSVAVGGTVPAARCLHTGDEQAEGAGAVHLQQYDFAGEYSCAARRHRFVRREAWRLA